MAVMLIATEDTAAFLDRTGCGAAGSRTGRPPRPAPHHGRYAGPSGLMTELRAR